MVAPGTIIATIGRVAPEAFEVVAVFDNNMAKRITAGLDVHVHPSSVRREEHGAMRGRVLSITELGVSKAELNAILRNPQLTDVLMARPRRCWPRSGSFSTSRRRAASPGGAVAAHPIR